MFKGSCLMMSYFMYFCATFPLFVCFCCKQYFCLQVVCALLFVKWMTSVAQYNNSRWILWTIVGGGGCVMVAITWLGCIVAFPESLQFSSSLEHKYQNMGQNNFLRWNVTRNDSLTLWSASFKDFLSLSFWKQHESKHDMDVKALDPLHYYELLGDKGQLKNLSSSYLYQTLPGSRPLNQHPHLRFDQWFQ